MKRIISTVIAFMAFATAQAQEIKWSETDRKYLLTNLIRSRDELIAETKGLTTQQYSFHESPDRWSINEVVEHLALYELVFDNEINKALRQGKRNLPAKADSTFLNFIMQYQKHYTLEYSKPFSFTMPMGLNSLENNLAWFNKMRNESIAYVGSTPDDLKAYFNDWGNIHQIYIYTFGHIDRQLRQIRKIKQHSGYPKATK